MSILSYILSYPCSISKNLSNQHKIELRRCQSKCQKCSTEEVNQAVDEQSAKCVRNYWWMSLWCFLRLLRDLFLLTECVIPAYITVIFVDVQLLRLEKEKNNRKYFRNFFKFFYVIFYTLKYKNFHNFKSSKFKVRKPTIFTPAIFTSITARHSQKLNVDNRCQIQFLRNYSLSSYTLTHSPSKKYRENFPFGYAETF